VDAAGNIYIAASASANYPVNNSLATCGVISSAALTVLDNNGDVLQATYIAGSTYYASAPALALGTGSAVDVIGVPSANYSATRQIPGSSGGLAFLACFSPNAQAQTV
jgi:hypothetical protein